MKPFKLLISVIMVATFGVNHVSGQCECIEITNETDCELEIRLTCSNGTKTGCLKVSPNTSTGFCASNFGCNTFDNSAGVEFNVDCDPCGHCEPAQTCSLNTYTYTANCGNNNSTNCPNCSNFGPFGYKFLCSECEFAITPD